MAEDEKYNGFSNWATWNIALWFDNSENLYRIKKLMLKEPNSVLSLSNQIKEHVLQKYLIWGKFGDIESLDELNSVNWEEISKNWMDDR